MRLHPNLKVPTKSIGVETWSEQESFKMNEVFEEIKNRMRICDERELTIAAKER